MNHNYFTASHVRGITPVARDFEEAWLRKFYTDLPSANGVECRIFSPSGGTYTESRVIYGPATKHVDPMLIRVTVWKPASVTAFQAAITVAVSGVQKWAPEHRLCPSNSGWMEYGEKGSVVIDLLFSKTGEELTAKSANFARRNALDFHIQERSRYLGMVNAYVARGDCSIASHDGAWYLKPRAFGRKLAYNPLKVVGYANYSQFIKKQGIVAKGMLVELSEVEWTALQAELGFGEEITAVVPAITIKFDRPEITELKLQVISVFETHIMNHAVLGVQAAERVPFTSWGNGVVSATFAAAVNEVMDAFRDKTGKKVMKLMDAVYREILEKAGECDLQDSDTDELLRDQEKFGALMTELKLLSVRGDEFLDAVLPVLLQSRVKTIRFDGITAVALPANIGEREILVNRKLARRLGLKIGDRVIIYRYPNTGIEMAEVVIVGFTDTMAIHLNPAFWASRFGGDFDGDLVGLIPVNGLVDESRINLASVPKQKGKGEMTIVESVARSFYAKYLIPKADQILTMAAEQGCDLAYPRSILQAIIDSIKHVVDVPSVELAMVQSGVIGDISDVAKLLRGRLGMVRRNMSIRYNLLVSGLTKRSGWLDGVCEEFKYLLAPNKNLDNKEYSELMTRLGRPEYGVRSSFAAARIPQSVTEPLRDRVLPAFNAISKDVEAVMCAHNIVDRYYEFGRILRERKVREAYDIIRDIREMVINHERGGDIMKYIFMAMTWGFDSKITLKPYKLLSYLPIKLGSYDLVRILQWMRYERVIEGMEVLDNQF